MCSWGVNVYGYLNAESGVGEHTRLLISALKEAGIDYAAIPCTNTLSRQESGFDNVGGSRPVYDVNIIGVNADSLPLFVEEYGRSAIEDCYTIGLWAWETEIFPGWMAESACLLDEVWANSSFSARAIAREIVRPVLSFPLPIQTPRPPPRTRAELGLPEGFLYMFCFDLDSVAERKNPLAVVESFKAAFAPNSGPHLVVKSVNGDRHEHATQALRQAIGDRNDILYRDGYLGPEDQQAFLAACDCYVSLHRSEGFGLSLAEAMALGKPTIATAYSGNLDFMSPSNSYLVPYDLVPIGKGKDPYLAEDSWAEVRVEAAARQMRRVYEMQDEARTRAQQAVEDIAAFHSPAVRARFVRERLTRIREELRNPAAMHPTGATPDATPPALLAALDEVHRQTLALHELTCRGPELEAHAVLGRLGRFVRKVALRTIRSFYLHQQETHFAVIRALEAVQLAVRQASTAHLYGHSRHHKLRVYLTSSAEICERLAGLCEQGLPDQGRDVVRDLHLLAARLRGMNK